MSLETMAPTEEGVTAVAAGVPSLMKELEYLFVHAGWAQYAIDWHRAIVSRQCARGYRVRAFCAVPRPPARRYDFAELDYLWRTGHPDVKWLHDRFIEEARGCDVVINFNGANIHPEWLRELDAFTIFMCWDDPESSEVLSRPVARYFDFAFTGNVACVPMYQSWDVQRCAYLPLAWIEGDCDGAVTVQDILEGGRDIEVVFLGERERPDRQKRLDVLQAAFPTGFYRGPGWPQGTLPKAECARIYRRAKIGVNIHNSVGPCNLRTFALPANGVLQVCDNKCRLGELFDLDREVIGFDTMEECVELVKYYLAHDKERREIAARGFERVMREYNEAAVWDRMLRTVAPFVVLKREGKLETPVWPHTVAGVRSVRNGSRSTTQCAGRTIR